MKLPSSQPESVGKKVLLKRLFITVDYHESLNLLALPATSVPSEGVFSYIQDFGFTRIWSVHK